MVFPEAVTERSIARSRNGRRSRCSFVAGITEFGATPLFTLDELRSADVSIAVSLSRFRAMNAAALNVYKRVREDGTQKNVLDTMQTRAELYDFLGYHAYEEKLDELFAKDKGSHAKSTK